MMNRSNIVADLMGMGCANNSNLLFSTACIVCDTEHISIERASCNVTPKPPEPTQSTQVIVWIECEHGHRYGWLIAQREHEYIHTGYLEPKPNAKGFHRALTLRKLIVLRKRAGAPVVEVGAA